MPDTFPIPANRLDGALVRAWVGPVEFAEAGFEGGDEWRPAMFGGCVDHGRLMLVGLNGVDGPYGRRPERVRLDPARPEVAHRVVDVLAAGERCPACSGRGLAKYDDDRESTCVCGTGYLRPPHDVSALLPAACHGGKVERVEWSAELLACSVERVERGMGPVRGIIAPNSFGALVSVTGCAVPEHLFEWYGGVPHLRSGKLEEALAAGFAYVEQGRLVCPWPAKEGA